MHTNTSRDAAAAAPRPRRARRRVIVPAPEGVDLTPQRVPRSALNPTGIVAELATEDQSIAWGDEDGPEIRADHASGSNDERIRENIPPHNV
ncbi:hypothetical protein [Gulosibacter bifidus]|uniref:Uncharacterized protein n=1 Tax=Gulosibacter bifidus TaxID=272239 RepID=A0ABW5RH20_9MICO|nr:hypothetical protein [Gulosibacter bifidus]